MAVRPRIQCCFLAWMEEARSRLAFPLRKLRRTDHTLQLGFDGVTPALCVILSRDDLDVRVEWQGKDWDGLFSEYVLVRRIRGGWTCEACQEDQRQVWPSREALWREHLFETVLRWVNGTLAPAELLAVHGGHHGTTWARLLTPEQRDLAGGATALLPVRVPQD